MPVRRSALNTIAICIFILATAIVSRYGYTGDEKIAATIFPLSDIAAHVAGEGNKVITILSPGADPHTFELTPQAVKALECIPIIFMVGHGLDDWVRSVAQSLSKAQMRTVDQGIELMESGGKDPHYWLSITNGKLIAKNIAQALSETNPSKRSEYQANLDAYLKQLDEAEQSIKNTLSGLAERRMITFHDGWRYFARDYGLKVIGSIESGNGKEPTPRRLVNLAEIISREKIKVLFSETTVPQAKAQGMVDDFHLRLYQLDPLGRKDQSYIELMKANARIVQEALGSGPENNKS